MTGLLVMLLILAPVLLPNLIIRIREIRRERRAPTPRHHD